MVRLKKPQRRLSRKRVAFNIYHEMSGRSSLCKYWKDPRQAASYLNARYKKGHPVGDFLKDILKIKHG